MVRCFVGYILPEDVRREIVKLQDEMVNWPMKCKMVEDKNLHINFSFLGDIEEWKIKKICEKIDSIGKDVKKIEVWIDGLRTIPNESYIRVIALHIVDETGFLKKLFDEIGERIGGDSKPPHITLCRVKSIINKEEIKKKVKESEMKIKLIIDAIQLIKSELNRSGPVYSIVHEFKLF